MSDSKNGCECVKGVGCDVYNCKYNDTECRCCKADHIRVENRTAMQKGETFCDTFTPKSSF